MMTRLHIVAALGIALYSGVACGQTDSIGAADAVRDAEVALAREFARVALIEARRAKVGPMRDHFDREPVGGGAPPLADSIPFGVTPFPDRP